MAPSRHLRRLPVIVGKTLVYLTVALLVLVGVALAVLETAWAKNQIRALIVRQANEYLTATLAIIGQWCACSDSTRRWSF